MITIVLAEGHHVVSKGLRALLDAQPDLQVVAEAWDGVIALQLVGRHHPSVLVTDLMMPNLGGLELTRRVRAKHPETQVVVLSVDAGQRDVKAALASGALGCIEKRAVTVDLVQAVRLAVRGRRYTSPLLAERSSDPVAREASSTLEPGDTLTPRERQVLQLAAHGRTNAQMGVQLGISPRTIEVHRANLMRKLRLRSRTDLVRYALKLGIVSLD